LELLSRNERKRKIQSKAKKEYTLCSKRGTRGGVITEAVDTASRVSSAEREKPGGWRLKKQETKKQLRIYGGKSPVDPELQVLHYRDHEGEVQSRGETENGIEPPLTIVEGKN